MSLSPGIDGQDNKVRKTFSDGSFLLSSTPHLSHQAESNPLVVTVVHQVLALPLPGALPLELRRDVEGGVHPAVGLQCSLTHSAPRQVALDGFSEELVAGDRDGAEDEESTAPSVVEPEDPVVYGGLLVSYLDTHSQPLQVCPTLDLSV